MINITEKDKQLYEEWGEERKKGLGDYFINNVAITSLVSTALFAVVLGILNLFNSKLSPGKIILFSVVFFLFFTLALAAFYYASWKKNEARFLKIKEYFEALPEYNQEKPFVAEEFKTEGDSEEDSFLSEEEKASFFKKPEEQAAQQSQAAEQSAVKEEKPATDDDAKTIIDEILKEINKE